MNEKMIIRRFVESDAGAVQNIIHRGLREVNGKDYPAELIETFCAYFSLEKIKNQAASAHMYVAAAGAAAYAALKFELKKRFKHDRDAYTEAKGEFIRACVNEVRKQRLQ